MFSSFPSIFETVEHYRYSITIGVGLLFFAPMLFPFEWAAVSVTWRYAVGATFFLSVGMIITRDVWPFFQRKVWGRTRRQEYNYAEVVVRHCKEMGGDPPFEINLSSFENEDIDKELLVEFLRAVTETDESVRLQDRTIIVTEEGLDTLKTYL